KLKLQTIEDLDHRLLAPILKEVGTWDEPVAIALLPDHPTPCKLRTHTAEPIPFCIYAPGMEPDDVSTFDEDACKSGAYGSIKGNEFIEELMKY
ncbi:MAG: phosphoglycerate mutase, partial [Prevotellaceae bacterium]|nr:phosphoglycerate mutase [Prevotellaceae bacterium]